MATSKKTLNDSLRNSYLQSVKDFLVGSGEEVLLTKSNEIAVPCVDADGNEKFVVLTFKVPSGSRDGDAYDGYSEAESYKLHLEEMAEKAKVAAEKKAKKVAADKAKREKKEEWSSFFLYKKLV